MRANDNGPQPNLDEDPVPSAIPPVEPLTPVRGEPVVYRERIVEVSVTPKAPVPWYRSTGILSARWVLGVLAALAVAASTCMAVIADWVTNDVADTSTFVATFEPMSANPLLQETIISQTGDAVETYVLENPVTPAVNSWVSSLLGFVQEDPLTQGLLGLFGIQIDPGAGEVVNNTTAAVAAEARDIAEQGAEDFITSPAFSDVWSQVLTDVHGQLMTALRAKPTNAPQAVDITLNVAPIVDGVVANLEGLPAVVGSFVPPIDEEVPLFQIEDITAMQTWFGWLGQGGQTYLWVAIGLAAFALLVSPKRWIALGLAGLSTAALAGFLVLQVPTFGKDNIVGLEVGQEPLIMEVWSMLSAPLTTELQTVFWWALSVTVVGAVGAVAVALLRNRKAIPSSV